MIQTLPFNYSQVLVDMHSHVLPGIDDGAPDVEESIILIRKMMDLGIRKIIATPHVMIDYYRNTRETISASLSVLKERLTEEGMFIEISAAAEHYFDEGFLIRIDSGDLMTMGDHYVLFEVSFISEPPSMIETIQKLTEKGYRPILAHPERYSYFNLEDLKMIRQWGCALQLNTISLTGYYGKEARQMAEQLVDQELVDFISSDMHHTRHAEAFEASLQLPYLRKLLFEGPELKNKLLFSH